MTDLDVNVGLHRSVEQFLFREARLLDERQWDAWLALWTDDGWYSLPHCSRSGFTRPGEQHYTNEPKFALDLRVAKSKLGPAWAEEPPSLINRLITNVEVDSSDTASLVVRSKFLLYRTQHERGTDTFVGARCDILQSNGGSFLIQRRDVYLNAPVMRSGSLEFFF